MKSFFKKIARELTGNLHKNPTKFSKNSRAISLRYDFIIVRLSHLRNPANRRAASDEKPTPELEIKGFNLFITNFNDKDSRGVAIYVKKSIISNQIEIENMANDTVWVEITVETNIKHVN